MKNKLRLVKKELDTKDMRDMNVFAQKGAKIQFIRDDEGFPEDRELVKKHLKMGDIYTVEKTQPMEWITAVWIQEVPGIAFNSVFFCDVLN